MRTSCEWTLGEVAGRRKWEWGDIVSPSMFEITWQTSQHWKEKDIGSHHCLPFWTLWKFILAFLKKYFRTWTINSNRIHKEKDLPTQKSFLEPKLRHSWDSLLYICACERCSLSLQAPWEAWNRLTRFQGLSPRRGQSMAPRRPVGLILLWCLCFLCGLQLTLSILSLSFFLHSSCPTHRSF